MSGGKVLASDVKSMAEDEPEEGEIQDDDGSLEDVSSDEDVSSVCRKKNCEGFYGNKFNVCHVGTENAAQSSRPYNSRAHKSYKRKRVSSTIEESQPRLSAVKYREETNKSSNGVYHVTLKTVAVDERRKENNFVDMLSEYKVVRPKQDIKDEIVQEKENRSDCQKEAKVKRKSRRKQRHSLLNNTEPRPSISSDIKTDCNVGSVIIGPEEEERKKKVPFTKLGTKSKSSHSKKRCSAPKREKHRCSKKKDGRKYLSKTFSDAIEKHDCTVNGAHGSSLLMRLQAMMMVNISARKEKTPVVSVTKKDEDIAKSQELERDLRTNPLPSLDAVKLDNENEKDCSEKAEIVGETKQNHLSGQTSEDIEALPDTGKHVPIVITIEDSDSELSVPAKVSECDSPEKVNKEGEGKAGGGETGMKGTDYEEDDDEDLVQLRLLALQSNRRKETSKPNVEDDEVMQLRLAALKSAIIKKCQVRKQRGIMINSKKMNALDSPGPSDLEKSNMEDDLGEKILRPETTFMEAVQSEPDETTTLVDMDLSHTDDESNAQSEMIIDPVSVDIPLPGNSESKFLPLMHEDYSTQNLPCINMSSVSVHEGNPVDLKENQMDDVMSAWSPAVTMYSSPDLESCRLTGMYNSDVQISSLNSVGYSNSGVPFPSSSFPQQQLYNELYQSNNSSAHPSTDRDATTSETVLSPLDLCVSTGVPGSFVLSDVNPSSFTSDALSASRVEPHVSANTFVPRTESPSLETNFIELDVPRASSVAVTKDAQFASVSSITHRTDNEVPGTGFVTSVQFHAVDCGTGSSSNGVRLRNIHMHSKNSVFFEKLPPTTHKKPTGKAERDPSAGCAVPTGLFSSSLNPQNQELKRTHPEDFCQNPVPIPAGETAENRAECSAQENSSEPENMDLSNMIVLDEVGQCSSPEAKVEEVSSELIALKNEGVSPQCDQSSLNLDEDEEVLRAKVLTTLARKPSTSAAFLTSKPQNTKDNTVSGPPKVSSEQQIENSTHSLPVLPNHISSSSINSVQPAQQTLVSHTKGKMPSKLLGSLHELKQCNKVFQRLPNKKLEHSQSSLSDYSKGNVVRTKYWKRSVKKGFSGSNTKQILTVVRTNPVPVKQVRGPSTVVRNDPQNMDLELNTRIAQCKPVSNTVPRVVFRPRVPKPTMIQVTVPATSVDDKQHKRKIAASVVSSVAPVQPPQRFVIRLGDDSDSPDEEEKIHQMPQAPKRRCVIKSSSSVLLWPASTSNIHIAPCDQVVNCDSNIASSLLSQYNHPLSDKQNTVSVLTQHATTSRISADFEKSVDIFLKQQRKSHEATAKEAPDESVGRKTNQVVSSATPLAVRHLPSSQQEEYRRLKQQIAELEEQRRRHQQQQHQQEQHQQQQKQLPPPTPPPPLSTNMTNSESSSLPSSPSQTTAVSSNINHPLNIALRNTKDGKKGVLQSSVTSAELGSDSGKSLRTQTAQNKRPSNLIISKDALLQKEAASDKGIAHTACPAPVMSEGGQRGTAEKASNLANVVRQKEESVMESKDGVLEVHDVSILSSCKHDCPSAVDESLEEKEAKLAEIEHQLLSKRYEVLDELTNMTTLLCQVERERATEEECLKDLRRIRGELHRVEERLSQQKQLLSDMRNDMAKSHRHVAQGRAACIGLSKTCLSIGIGVKGRSYKVPAGGAELMNRKLQQVAAQTRRMSRKKDNSEDSDENPYGSDVPSFLNLQVAVQDKTEMRTACIAVDSSEDNSAICNKVHASSTMDVNTESISQENEIMLIQSTENTSMLVSSSDISQIKSTNSSEMLDCKISELSSKSSVQSLLSEVNETSTASKLDSRVQVEGHTAEAERSHPVMTDIERMSTDVPEASDMMVMGVGSYSKETVSQHLSEYRSPLEHFHSKRGESEAGREWCGPLDPLAILCPYELMGSCQDEECGYHHQSKSTLT